MYDFYFFEYKKQLLLSASVFVIALSYMVLNVFMLGRNEQKALYEAVWITITLSMVFPVLFCKYLYEKKRDTTHDVVTLHAMFYRKTPPRAVRWKGPSRQRYRQKRHRHVIYWTDAHRQSHILQ
jgi:hypothetical protein